MSEWKEVTIGSVANIISDKTEIINASLYNYISTDNMLNNFGGIVKAEKLPNVKKVNTFKKNDVLFSNIRTYFKKVWQSSFDGTVSADVLVFRVKNEAEINNRFFFYLLCNPDFTEYSVLTSRGAKMPRGDKEALRDYRFILPPLPEQKAIAGVLSSLDDKIDLLHRQNETLEAMAETLFREWFIEEAEDDWEEGVLGDVLYLRYGKGLKKTLRTGRGFPVVGSSGIVDYHSEYLVKGPGIVIGRKGTLGKIILLWQNFFPIDTTYFIEPKSRYPYLLYDYFLLRTINFNEMNTDSAVPGLNRDIALSTEVVMPPTDKQSQFERVVYKLYRKIDSNFHQIQTITKIRDTLLTKLMNGEVKLNV
ncbi:MAG: restriction endonuclease subunit S [Spirochaetia bacterium]|nr:restriction endonuclease subunit S [Spirochaetia bacterium]MCF7945382.1 restriction endonuclease subunit S [Spirochaetia bacterium]